MGGKVWVVKSQIHAGGRGMGRFIEQVSAGAIAEAAERPDARGVVTLDGQYLDRATVLAAQDTIDKADAIANR